MREVQEATFICIVQWQVKLNGYTNATFFYNAILTKCDFHLIFNVRAVTAIE